MLVKLDDADSSLDLSSATTWFADSDGDTFGDTNSSQTTCTQPANTVTNDSDCDDTTAAVNPNCFAAGATPKLERSTAPSC